MTKIAVIGNRTGWTRKEVHHQLYLFGIGAKDTIVSGGAGGVDSFAEQFARDNGLKFVAFFPNPDKPSPERYYARNRKIVKFSDIVIAFNKQKTGGTVWTINYAKKQVVALSIFGENKCLNCGFPMRISGKIRPLPQKGKGKALNVYYCDKCGWRGT